MWLQLLEVGEVDVVLVMAEDKIGEDQIVVGEVLYCILFRCVIKIDNMIHK